MHVHPIRVFFVTKERMWAVHLARWYRNVECTSFAYYIVEVVTWNANAAKHATAVQSGIWAVTDSDTCLVHRNVAHFILLFLLLFHSSSSFSFFFFFFFFFFLFSSFSFSSSSSSSSRSSSRLSHYSEALWAWLHFRHVTFKFMISDMTAICTLQRFEFITLGKMDIVVQWKLVTTGPMK